jgi:hypothetical protein
MSLLEISRKDQPMSMKPLSTANLSLRMVPIVATILIYLKHPTIRLQDVLIGPSTASNRLVDRAWGKSGFSKTLVSRYLTSRYSPVRCEWVGCTYDRAFTRDMSLWRHIKDKHIPKRIECGRCNRAFGRQDKLQEHIRTVHSRYKQVSLLGAQ